jgi:hypothetical protein
MGVSAAVEPSHIDGSRATHVLLSGSIADVLWANLRSSSVDETPHLAKLLQTDGIGGEDIFKESAGDGCQHISPFSGFKGVSPRGFDMANLCCRGTEKGPGVPNADFEYIVTYLVSFNPTTLAYK